MKIKIVIEGECAEGKTTMSLLIAHALRQAGFGVHNGDYDVQEGIGYEHLQGSRLAAMIAKDVLIDIETVQTRKETR